MKRIISLQIDDELLKAIDRISLKLGLSRSDIIRLSLKEYIELLERKTIYQEYSKFV